MDVDKIIAVLKDRNSEDGYSYFDNIPDFNFALLIRPTHDKELWEKCAEIICKLDDERIINIMPELLTWFKDLNWPGAVTIQERIEKIPRCMIDKYVDAAYSTAQEQNNMWAYWLEHIFYNK